MPFKLNISDKGKAWKLESVSEIFVGKSIDDKIIGKDISEQLEGYELKVAGASDVAGFPHKKDVEGRELKRVLLTRGWGMHDNTEGMRRRKTVRGKQLSEKTMQINLIVVKAGAKTLQELFPEQNQPKEKKAATPTPAVN